MKALASLLLVPVALVHAMINPNRFAKSGSMARVSNGTAPTCGVGYTYCGYILQQEKREPSLLPSSMTATIDADIARRFRYGPHPYRVLRRGRL